MDQPLVNTHPELPVVSDFGALEYACETPLLIILSIRSGTADIKLEYKALKKHLVARLEEFRETTLAQNVPEATVNDALYALVAFADESVAAHLDDWNNALAIHFFDEYRAGEVFFHKINTLIKEGTSPELARIYSLCLEFGFRGEYALRNADDLDHLQQTLSKLGNDGQADFFDFAKRESQAFPHPVKRVSPIWYTAIFAGFALVFAITLSLRLDDTTAQAVDWMNKQTPQAKLPSATPPPVRAAAPLLKNTPKPDALDDSRPTSP